MQCSISQASESASSAFTPCIWRKPFSESHACLLKSLAFNIFSNSPLICAHNNMYALLPPFARRAGTRRFYAQPLPCAQIRFAVKAIKYIRDNLPLNKAERYSAAQAHYRNKNQRNKRHGSPKIGQLFDGFNNFGSSLILMLLNQLLIFLWTMLFIIPGIIKSYSYPKPVQWIPRLFSEISCLQHFFNSPLNCAHNNMYALTPLLYARMSFFVKEYRSAFIS